MLLIRTSRSALPLVVALSLAACGSTVQNVGSEQAVIGGPAGLGLGGAMDAGPGGLTQGAGDELGAAGDAAGGSSAGTSPLTVGGAGSGTAGTPTAGAAPTSGATGKGRAVVGDRTPIKVGFVRPDFTKLVKAVGGSSDDYAAIFGGEKNMVAAINKRGGIGGHPIQDYYHATDGAATDYATEAQRACVKMTQDLKVDVVITISYFREDFNECLRKAGVAQIDSDQFANAPAVQRGLPTLLTPNALNIDAAYRTLIDKMHQTKWLTSKSYVGVLIEGCPQNRRAYSSVVEPRVKDLGSRSIAVTFDCLNGTGDIGGAQSAIKSAVLRFQSEGVDRVMVISAAEAALLVGFQQNAASQGYRPGYMITSYALPTGFTSAYPNGQGSTTTGDQRTMMRGIGWNALIDLNQRVFPENKRQAQAQAACHELDPTENNTVGKTDPIGTAYFMWSCDSLQILSAVLIDSGFATDPASVRQSYLRVAPTVPSAGNPLGTFAPQAGHTDGVAAVYTYAFSTECNCFVSDGATGAPSR